jgi:hypothetical protein
MYINTRKNIHAAMILSLSSAFLPTTLPFRADELKPVAGLGAHMGV